MVEMNSIPWSPILRYATPLPMNRTPISAVALQHKSVSSVLRYATPLPINRTHVSTVGGPFPPLCYSRPRFHRLFRPSPPDEHDDAFRSDRAGWLPMNTTMTLFLRSDPAMYVCASRRSRPRPYVHIRGRIFFLAPWPLYVRVHATCAPLLRHVHASTTKRARLYIDQYICTYTFATKMTMLRTLRPGGSRLSGTSLHAKM